MYVEIHKIIGQETKFHEGYEWTTPEITHRAFNEAKQAFEVPFEEAAYLVDLYDNNGDNLETFPLSTQGYLQMVEVPLIHS